MKSIFWTIKKNGKLEPYVFKSKRSLLISFDMMPLRGLGKTERVLVKGGMVPTRVKVIQDDTGEYYAFRRNEVLDLSPETLGITEEMAYAQAALREFLPWFAWTTASNIAPKRTAKVREKTVSELKRRGIDVITISLMQQI